MSKVAIISGAGGYIGSETARTLAREGIAVAVCDINAETVQKTVDSILAFGGSAKGYVFDVTDSKSVDETVSAVVADFGRLDISVHVAGGSARSRAKNLIEQCDEVIESVIKVNLMGAFWMSRAAARVMVKQGEGGRIINFSSAVGLCGLKRSTDYAAAKGGVISMTRALAKELGPHKITVNSVAPGIVMRPEEKGGDERALGTNVLGEKCYPSDIADMVAYLASDKARFITGQTYVVDGGRSLSMKGSD